MPAPIPGKARRLFARLGLALLGFLCIPSSAFGVEPQRVWERIFPASGGFVQTMDRQGNVFFSGVATGSRWRVQKYSASDGTLVWEGFTPSLRTTGLGPKAMATDRDGNLVVAGMAETNDMYTAKFDGATGSFLWHRTYGGPGNGLDHAHAVAADSNGNIVVLGQARGINFSSDFAYVAKFSPTGALLWEKDAGTAFSDDSGGNPGFRIAIDQVDNVIVFKPSSELNAAKLSGATGQAIWTRTIHGGNAVTIDDDNNLILTSSIFHPENGSFSVAAQYASSDGSLVWEAALQGVASSNAVPSAIAVDLRGDVVVVGWFVSPTNHDAFTAKFSGDAGGFLWQRTYASNSNQIDRASVLALTSKGDVLMSAFVNANPFDGVSNADIYTVKYSSQTGETLWETLHDGSANGADRPTFLGVGADDNPILVGLTTVAHGLFAAPSSHQQQFYLAKYADPARFPVLFIPGMAGSVLESSGIRLWPTVRSEKIDALNLATGASGIEATDVLRYVDSLDIGLELFRLDFYQPFINHMINNLGYVEFSLGGDRTRLISDYMLSLDPKPTLFLFPYDWRRSNTSHVAVLHQYITRIRELYPESKVNIVAHSMGGLLARRYVLEHGTNVSRVATIGTPVWGAPVAVYRMLRGDFYDLGILDFFVNPSIRRSLKTFPGFYELFPSEAYLENGGLPVFSEEEWDFDGDGITSEEYSEQNLWSLLNSIAAPQAPATANALFHGFAQGRLDDWSQDDSSIQYLHIVGNQGPASTTTQTIARAWPTTDARQRVSIEHRWVERKGEGDGTVPLLSAQRLTTFLAPSTRTTNITGGRAAGHIEMVSNPLVFQEIATFFGDAAAPDDFSRAASAQAITLGASRFELTISGCDYVKVTDIVGNQNTPVGDIAALRIPDVEIQYGTSNRPIQINASAASGLVVEGFRPSDLIKLALVGFGDSGSPRTLHRYRFTPHSNTWKLELSEPQQPDLKFDANGDGQYDTNELVQPIYAAIGDVDVIPPTITCHLSISNGLVVMDLLGEDDVPQPPGIWISANDEPVVPYAQPLPFDLKLTQTIKAFAQDEAGNTSALIETAINPSVLSGSPSNGVIVIRWPVAQGYVLEAANSPSGT